MCPLMVCVIFGGRSALQVPGRQSGPASEHNSKNPARSQALYLVRSRTIFGPSQSMSLWYRGRAQPSPARGPVSIPEGRLVQECRYRSLERQQMPNKPDRMSSELGDGSPARCRVRAPPPRGMLTETYRAEHFLRVLRPSLWHRPCSASGSSARAEQWAPR